MCKVSEQDLVAWMRVLRDKDNIPMACLAIGYFVDTGSIVLNSSFQHTAGPICMELDLNCPRVRDDRNFGTGHVHATMPIWRRCVYAVNQTGILSGWAILHQCFRSTHEVAKIDRWSSTRSLAEEHRENGLLWRASDKMHECLAVTGAKSKTSGKM